MFLIVDWPEQCRFLNAKELALLKRRLADDGADTARMDTLNRYSYGLILGDWKIWLGSLVYVSTYFLSIRLSIYLFTYPHTFHLFLTHMNAMRCDVMRCDAM